MPGMRAKCLSRVTGRDSVEPMVCDQERSRHCRGSGGEESLRYEAKNPGRRLRLRARRVLLSFRNAQQSGRSVRHRPPPHIPIQIPARSLHKEIVDGGEEFVGV